MANAEGFKMQCKMPGCPNTDYLRGYCQEHYRDYNKRTHSGKGRRFRKSATWKRVRLQVLIDDDYLCKIQLEGCEGRAETVDHIVSIEDGGDPFARENLQSACNKCNSKKALNEVRNRDYAARDERMLGDR